MIRSLFETTRKLDRRIEKVISFDSNESEQLKREITEYVATDNIETNFERMLSLLDEGLGGGAGEVGVWVSGFYGSGKSSFTKYLGFALDPQRKIDGKPFLEWLQAQLKTKALRTQLAALAKKHPATVIMLDLASAQIAGATMAEISSVLYWTVLQWAGYPRDKKVAHLQFMLERDGKMPEFEKRIQALAKGKTWQQIQNQPLVVAQFSAIAASELYNEVWPTPQAFQQLKIDEVEMENERVTEMLDLVRRKSGRENIIFILDEVGQYIGARDNLILNLDGLAKNIKGIGKGKAWLIATAQQTLTEDDPRAQMNSGKLFKLSDRFPIRVDLEASDIKEICYTRLLTKASAGVTDLENRFNTYGPQLRLHTQLQNTRFYKSDLDKKTFCDLYPFLPQHFDILLELLGRLAKTSGGIGLRSAIKVIQDVLVDQSGYRPNQPLLADQAVGTLATTAIFYDTLRRDIQKSFKHVIEGVERVEKVHGADSIHDRVAKSVAVLQVLEDFPVSRENVAALLHPSVDSDSLLNPVKAAVDELLKEPAFHLSEIDGRLRFMSEAVAELEAERQRIVAGPRETRVVMQEKLRELFDPLPSAKLKGTRTVQSGLKLAQGNNTITLEGEREPVQTVIEFVPATNYEKRKQERLVESNERANTASIFLLAKDDAEVEDLLAEIVRCQSISKKYRNNALEKEVSDYINGQVQRATSLSGKLDTLLKKLLTAGSFVFRAKPVAVSVLDNDLLAAANKQLDGAAEEVFEKYSEAAIQAEGALAERLLKTNNLAQIASRDNPLGLVKTVAGKTSIDTAHAAAVSLRDYLDRNGTVDGRKLLDDFFGAPYGWSKDTTRYIIAALLIGGEVKLRVGGADVLVGGDAAIEALKNNNSFNKAGVALRDSRPSLEAMTRAIDRLLELTGDVVVPVEGDIAKAVTKHFPVFQRDYAALSTKLDNLDLAGVDRAESIQDSVTEILRGDASDATTWLGGEQCPLYDDLLWARSVHKAFKNGIDAIISDLKRHCDEIAALPDFGVTGKLLADTATSCVEAAEFISREDFHAVMPDLQNRLKSLQIAVENTVETLKTEQATLLQTESAAIQASPDWSRIGLDDQTRLSARLEKLVPEAPLSLAGLKKLLGHQYAISTELERVKTEVRELAKPKPQEPPPEGEEPKEQPVEEVTLSFPNELSSEAEADVLIAELGKLKVLLASGKRLRIRWQ
jgi:hypothetical protein